MKFNKANFDLMAVVGGIAGGVVAKVVENFTTKEDQENNYLTIGVMKRIMIIFLCIVPMETVR